MKKKKYISAKTFEKSPVFGKKILKKSQMRKKKNLKITSDFSASLAPSAHRGDSWEKFSL